MDPKPESHSFLSNEQAEANMTALRPSQTSRHIKGQGKIGVLTDTMTILIQNNKIKLILWLSSFLQFFWLYFII